MVLRRSRSPPEARLNDIPTGHSLKVNARVGISSATGKVWIAPSREGLHGGMSMEKSRTHGAKRVKFQIEAPPGSDVFLVGSFNDWNPAKTRMRAGKDGCYAATVALPAGTYEYKFFVNGQWRMDPANRDWLPNPYGSLNNVLQVGGHRAGFHQK